MTAVTNERFNPTIRANQISKRATEALRKLPWLTEAQAALSWGILITLFAILGAVYLNQASRIATIGRRIQLMQDDLDEINRINGEIKLDIARGQELTGLEARAFALGFVKPRPEDIEYVVIPNYPADLPAESVFVPDLVPPPDSLREALWLMMKESVSDLTSGESYEP